MKKVHYYYYYYYFWRFSCQIEFLWNNFEQQNTHNLFTLTSLPLFKDLFKRSLKKIFPFRISKKWIPVFYAGCFMKHFYSSTSNSTCIAWNIALRNSGTRFFTSWNLLENKNFVHIWHRYSFLYEKISWQSLFKKFFNDCKQLKVETIFL